ncbi:hypothetical protein GCK72_025017 [Caenorhabditis remanei]|uniref:Uncharacterized protein n=1 Tax=Caenorhabditis remanei TaxID=31234 RepID=A0A6A5G0S3_CAERE|nr:hypothetical protein GCK72_025017 [Caenorhabditis remanei]KAF1748550.1 hypothetical protein GCK72_025017 [Caenorhabditis remanei]
MLLVFAHYLCLGFMPGLVLNDNTCLHNTNRRIGPNDVNDESRSEGWRIIGAEIEIANKIDTFSEVGYLYDGLYEGLISEMMFDFADGFGDEEEHNGNVQMADHYEEEREEDNIDEVDAGSQEEEKIVERFAFGAGIDLLLIIRNYRNDV